METKEQLQTAILELLSHAASEGLTNDEIIAVIEDVSNIVCAE